MTCEPNDPQAMLGRFSWREVSIWACAALLVLIAHASAALYLHQALTEDNSHEAVEEALMVELAPLTLSQAEEVQSEELVEETPSETPPEEITEKLPEEVQPVEEEVVETVEPEQQIAALEPEIEPLEEVEEVEQIEPDPIIDELVEEPDMVLPESDVPMPVARPMPEKPKPVVREKPKLERPKEVVRDKPKPVEVAKAAPAPAPSVARASTAPSITPAKWQSRVIAHINRRKGSISRRSRGRGQAYVLFSINNSGGVTASRISQSSGDQALDQLALDLIKRSSPVPTPPENGPRTLNIPISFER